MDTNTHKAYWRANLKLVALLLSIWALVSFGASIGFAETLNAFHLFGFPLGFWFAQQGSIYVFVVLIFVYVHQIGRIEKRLGLDGESTEKGPKA